MMRLLGVLVGSALAVAALVVFIGVPEFTNENSVAGNTVITLPMRTETAAAVEAEAARPVDATAIPAVAAAVNDDPAAIAEPESEIEPEPEPAPEIIEAAPEEALDELQQWYAFWSPFRSEIAASGFVDQLQRVTGLDYRVVKIKPGVYEVAFAYVHDAEITDSLSQITAATGLQLPEG